MRSPARIAADWIIAAKASPPSATVRSSPLFRPCLRGADAASRRHAAPARQNFALWMVVDLWTSCLAEREVVLIGYGAAMAMTKLEIAPLHPSLGAEITGVDLGQPIDVTTRQAPVTRPGRPPGASVSRSDADARAVSRRRVGVRPADGAALLSAQHAG